MSFRQTLAADILSRHDQLGFYQQYDLFLAFDYTKDKLEFESGTFSSWPDEDKIRIARQLLETAEAYFSEDRNGACGAILLSLYLEAQASQVDRGKEMIASIEQWHRQAVARELIFSSQR